MAYNLQKQRIIALEITDNDIEPFILGIQAIAKDFNKPGFKSGKKGKIAKLFKDILDDISDENNE